MPKISALGKYSSWDDIEIEVEDLDDTEVQAVIAEARSRGLLAADNEQIEDMLSMLRRRDLVGLESYLESMLPPRRSDVDVIQAYRRWKESRDQAA